MEIRYDEEKDGNYSEWCEAMMNSGFTIPFSEVIETLHVSRNWINKNIQPNVPYVKIWNGIARKTKDAVYFHEFELREWLTENATFTRQTRLFPILTFTTEGKLHAVCKELDLVLNRKYGLGRKSSIVYGYIDPRILEALGCSHMKNVDERSRKQYPHKAVEPFDFYSKEKIHPSDYSSVELAYRSAFRLGYTKVQLFGKTIFVKAEDLDVMYPMTIQF